MLHTSSKVEICVINYDHKRTVTTIYLIVVKVLLNPNQAIQSNRPVVACTTTSA